MKDNEQEKNQQGEMPEEKKVTKVSSAEEMFAILDGEAIKVTENGKTKYFYLNENEQAEVAQQIAEMYLQKFPRPKSYAVHLSSTEDHSEMTFYQNLTDKEIAIIRSWEELPDNDEGDYTLQEYLEENGYTDLLEKLMCQPTPFPLNILDWCDLNDTLQFTSFSIQFKEDNGNLGHPSYIGFPLTDSEFVELLVQCLLTSNRLSMNMLVYRMPELAQRIIAHLTWAYCDYQFETYNDSIIDLVNLKSVAQSILDPTVDILHLSESEDIRIKAFLKGHKIEKDNE